MEYFVVSRFEFVYPAEARKRHMSGTVRMHVQAALDTAIDVILALQ
jgi:hypothetical protein